MLSTRCKVVILIAAMVAAPAFAGFAGSDVFLPTAAHAAGQKGTYWYTDVWIHNPNGVAVDVSIYLLVRDQLNTSAVPVVDTIQPGDTKFYDDIVGTMFGQTVWGALRIVTAGGQEVLVSCRVYNQLPGAPDKKDSAGQDFSGIPASLALGVGDTSNILGIYSTLPSSSSDFRFRYGFVEVTGHTVKVRVTPIDGTGAALASPVTHQIVGLSQRQWLFESVFPSVDTMNARLKVEVVSGPGKAIGYGLTVANGTTSEDPTTFEMAYKDSLLAVGRSIGTFNAAVWSTDGSVISGGLQFQVSSLGLATFQGSADLPCGPDVSYSLDFSDTPAVAVTVNPDGTFTASVSIPYEDGGTTVFTTTWTLAGTIGDDGSADGTLTSDTSDGSGDFESCNASGVMRNWHGAWSPPSP
jgi:hypothetical protein